MKVTLAITSLLVYFTACLHPAFPQSQDCQFPYQLVEDLCILIYPRERGSWFEMRLFCAEQSMGGNLVKITTPSQLSALQEAIQESGKNETHYWIAATDEGQEGLWRYTDGTDVPMGPFFWRYECSEGYPLRPLHDSNANCAALDQETHYHLADFNCQGNVGSIPFSPICQNNPY
ncbi:perlucin-like protein [Macrobrachium nipponense]|uniref:perlucin-like protein n=1 Tax=Macrobrachium nipponense TaxID=159736 RepID=UPI0030C804E5